MWTKEIKSVNEIKEGVFEVEVTISNGNKTVDRTYQVSSKADLLNKINRQIKAYEERQAALEALKAGEVTEEAEPKPDAAAIAKAEWLSDFQELEGATKLASVGIDLPANQVAALRTKVENTFNAVDNQTKKEYLRAVGGIQ